MTEKQLYQAVADGLREVGLAAWYRMGPLPENQAPNYEVAIRVEIGCYILKIARSQQVYWRLALGREGHGPKSGIMTYGPYLGDPKFFEKVKHLIETTKLIHHDVIRDEGLC